MVKIGQHLPKQPGSRWSFQDGSNLAWLAPQREREKSNKLAESVPSSVTGKKPPSGGSSAEQKSPITIKEHFNGPLSPPKAAHMPPEPSVPDLAGGRGVGRIREERLCCSLHHYPAYIP